MFSLYRDAEYLMLLVGAYILRAICSCFRSSKASQATSSFSINLATRNGIRKIRTNVYNPRGRGHQRNVLVNLSGGGFVVDGLGTNDDFCRAVADAANMTVYDVQYRLAPEHPFPAALNDAVDFVRWLRVYLAAQWPNATFSVSGFGSGATLALALVLDRNAGSWKYIIAFYPTVDYRMCPRRKVAALNGEDSMFSDLWAFLWGWLLSFCERCYLFGFLRDVRYLGAVSPRMIPLFYPPGPQPFTGRFLFITPEQDRLTTETWEMVEKLRHFADHRWDIQLRRVDQDHAWDEWARPNTVQWVDKYDMYDEAIRFLRGPQGQVQGQASGQGAFLTFGQIVTDIPLNLVFPGGQ